MKDALLPAGFKLPTMMPYERKTYLQEHLDHFNNLMELHHVLDLEKCRCFAVTLTKGAKKWFMTLEPGSTSTWSQLTTTFVRQYQATK